MIRAIAAALAAGALLASCGGGAALPEAAPCPTPFATATPGTLRLALTQYYHVISTGAAELETSLAGFRARYPDGKFYRSESFRPAFVEYAGSANCELDTMAAATPPDDADENTTSFESELEGILTNYRTQLDRGLAAIRQRNTSDYRDFNRNIDTVAQQLRDLVDSRVARR